MQNFLLSIMPNFYFSLLKVLLVLPSAQQFLETNHNEANRGEKWVVIECFYQQKGRKSLLQWAWALPAF